MFPAQTYVERRQRLQTKVRSGLLLFLGNAESPMNYPDNTFHFRQDSSFLYFLGVDQPGYAGVMDLDAGTTTLFADDLTLDAIVWTGPQPTVAEWAAQAGIQNTAPADQLGEVLQRARVQGRAIHFLPPYRPENRLRLLDLLGIPPAEQGAKASLEFIQAVVSLRIHKDAEELVEIEKAVTTTVAMHLAGIRMARPGLKESDLAARVAEIALAAGGQLSFPIIATVHGETLHNHFHGNALESGQLFLLDAGAESALHYAGDLTSTFPVDPTFTPRQREVYEIVLAAHMAAVAALKPGIRFREVHLLACRQLAEGLKGLGLMQGDLDEAVALGAHAMFFQCGLGHMMGLDVHDMEDLGEVWVGHEGQPKSTQFGLKSLRLARGLEPGFVFTVEPGLYFIPELMDRWRAERKFTAFINYEKLEDYRGFGGIRIEEDFVMTEQGARMLGPRKPRTAAEVEALRAEP
ncbi:MAG: aminopeptidase P N-terminal domain-containing protein [Holophaga sp.]|nr:aminopeptidase P N-terminal domain-containing protein [Holophaga sp.]